MIGADRPVRIGKSPAEVGRYETASGERRALVAQEVEGAVRVIDRPVCAGRSYFVEDDFETMGELAMLVADYKREAERFGCCPMSREAIWALICLDEDTSRATTGEQRDASADPREAEALT